MTAWYAQDVVFDHAAASRAVDELERRANGLAWTAELLRTDVGRVGDDWFGGHAVRFGEVVEGEAQRLADAADQLRELAVRIRTAATEAAHAQLYRERRRAAAAEAARAQLYRERARTPAAD